ncbi:MAG: hypothetical protein K2J33_03660, partial [Alistipes sp.]|nr:hypothetical protein [Alistipes sp.]
VLHISEGRGYEYANLPVLYKRVHIEYDFYSAMNEYLRLGYRPGRLFKVTHFFCSKPHSLRGVAPKQ